MPPEPLHPSGGMGAGSPLLSVQREEGHLDPLAGLPVLPPGKRPLSTRPRRGGAHFLPAGLSARTPPPRPPRAGCARCAGPRSRRPDRLVIMIMDPFAELVRALTDPCASCPFAPRGRQPESDPGPLLVVQVRLSSPPEPKPRPTK